MVEKTAERGNANQILLSLVLGQGGLDPLPVALDRVRAETDRDGKSPDVRSAMALVRVLHGGRVAGDAARLTEPELPARVQAQFVRGCPSPPAASLGFRVMGNFHPLAESKLAELEDPALIEYAIAARRAGEATEATLALRIFAFGMEDPVRRFIQARLRSHGEAVIDEILERTLESALSSIESLTGTTPPEARAFVFRIARRRIADHLRKARPQVDSLDDEDGLGASSPPSALRVEDHAGAVESGVLIDELLATLRPDHREVVELNLLSGFSARETVEMLNRRDDTDSDDSMSEPNVHQISSRFRKELRARFSEGSD